MPPLKSDSGSSHGSPSEPPQLEKSDGKDILDQAFELVTFEQVILHVPEVTNIFDQDPVILDTPCRPGAFGPSRQGRDILQPIRYDVCLANQQ